MSTSLALRRILATRTRFSLSSVARPRNSAAQFSRLSRSTLHVGLPFSASPVIIVRALRRTCARYFSAATSVNYTASDLGIQDYHKISDETMERMVEYFEALAEEVDTPGYDVEYVQGVLTLSLGTVGTYLLNKQPPNKQIWLSSPKSGPKRYDYDVKRGKWFYQRDQSTMDELLNKELGEILGRAVGVLG